MQQTDKIVFATRPSALARWQTQWVISEMQRLHPGLVCEEKIITTQGDRILDKPLPEIGGKGLFTQELENELLAGTVNCAVHSLKDLPVEDPRGLVIGCIPARAEVRDAWVSRDGIRIGDLKSGSLVGTSSLRRSSQLLAYRPDLQTGSLRGNVDTRLRKLRQGQYAAIILAGAGLGRLGLAGHITELLPLDIMLPAPGQGALAIQCRAEDHTTLEILAALEDNQARRNVTAERAFLSGLGGGCSLPVAAFATRCSTSSPMIELTGLVSALDGVKSIKVSGQGTDPGELGRRLALDAISQGALHVLDTGKRS